MAPDTTDWRAVAVIVVGGVTAAMQVGKAAIALPALRLADGDAWSLTASEGAWLLALPGVVGCLGAVLVGVALKRIQPAAAFAAALLGAAISAFAGAAAGSGPTLLAARALEAGCGLVVMIAAPVVLGSVVAPRDRLLALGVWSAYMPFGQAVVVVAGGWIVRVYDWPMLWLGTAVVSLAAGVWAALFGLPRVSAPDDGPQTQGCPAQVRDWGRIVLLGAIFMAYTFQWMALTGYLPTVLTDLGVSLGTTGALTALVLVGNVVGNLAAGLLGRRGVAAGWLLASGLVVMVVAGSLVFSGAAPVVLKVVAAFAFSAFGGLVPGTLFGQTALPGPVPIGQRNALLIQGSQLGAALGPVLLGAVVAIGGGWHAAVPLMVIAGSGALLVCGLWAFGDRKTLVAANQRHHLLKSCRL